MGYVGINNTISTGGKLVLNNNQTGFPSSSATNWSYITVNRASSADVSMRWNEGTDKWQFTNDGSTYYDFVTADTNTGILNVVEDLTPQLGGDLDVNGNKITAIGTYGEIPIEVNINSVATELVKFGYDPVNPTSPVAARYGTTFTDKVWIDANSTQQFDLYDVVTNTADITSDAGIYMNFIATDGISAYQTRASLYHQNNLLAITSHDKDDVSPQTNYLQLTLRPIMTSGGLNLTSVVDSVATSYDVVTEFNAEAIIGAKADYFSNPVSFAPKTTTQRDALTGMVDGDMIWNITTDKINTYDGSAWTEVGGGGGAALELYAENPSSPTAPSATGTNAVAIGNAASATNAETTAVGQQALASGTNSAAFGHRATASGSYSVAAGSWCTASAVGSAALGGSGVASGAVVAGAAWSTAIGLNSSALGSQTATGSGAMALGGSRASGTDSFAAAIADNTATYGATGANSIAMGYQARATQADSIAIGDRVVATGNPSIAVGRQITASGAGSSGFGNNYHGTNTVSGAGAIVVTGGGVTASGIKSAVFGSYSGATAERSFAFGINATALTYGKFAFSAKGFNQDFYVDGSAQAGLSIVSRTTTDATAAYLSGSTTPVAANQILLPNNSAYAFSGMIVARQDPAAGTACAAWKVEGLIRREANAASTVLVNYALTVLDNTPAWDITLTADTTIGALKITATGAAATTIRWVATINTAEVNFLN